MRELEEKNVFSNFYKDHFCGWIKTAVTKIIYNQYANENKIEVKFFRKLIENWQEEQVN